MKAVIFTEAGPETGFGHLVRCVSLRRGMVSAGIQAEIAVDGGIATAILRRTCGDKSVFSSCWLTDHSVISRLLKGADCAVVDSYLASREVYGLIASSVRLPVFIDDNHRLRYPEGIIVNGAMLAEKGRAYGGHGRLCLLGSRYIPLRPAFASRPRRRNGPVRDILVTFGGSDPRGMTAVCLRALKDIPHRKTVIVGAGSRDKSVLRKFSGRRIILVNSPSEKRMAALMDRADIAVSATGQTLYELAARGVPTVAVRIADNQASNIRGFVGAGLMRYAGSWDSPRIGDRIRREVSALEDSGCSARALLSFKLRKAVDGRGAGRIGRFIASKL